MHQQINPIRLIVFPGAFNWPIWVAQELNFFIRHGVDVEICDTPGSEFQLSQLIQGNADLAITLSDNVIAYREGQGEAPIVGSDLVALMASDTRVLPALVTASDIKSYQDLKGKVLAVDAYKTGYTNLLLAMLESGGLSPGDYEIVSAGGVQQRFNALLDGKYAGALFNSPFQSLLVENGFTLMDTAARVFSRYQGQVLAARQSWANSNKERVIGFIKSFLIALAWLYDEANREHAYKIFRDRQPHAGPQAAATAFQVLFNQERGFPLDGKIDLEAFNLVVELRSRFGIPKKKLGMANEYVDSSFLEEALLSPSILGGHKNF